MGRKNFYQTWVIDKAGKLRKYTPQQIIDTLRSEIRLSKEWSIEPKELVSTISKPEFPELKGNEIKTLIMDYCSDILETGAFLGQEKPDIYIVTYCYYTAYGDDAVAAKNRYKKCTLDAAIKSCLEKQNLSIEDAQSKKWVEGWILASSKNFCRFFGPELSRWEYKIKKRFDYDFKQRFSSFEEINSLGFQPREIILQQTGN